MRQSLPALAGKSVGDDRRHAGAPSGQEEGGEGRSVPGNRDCGVGRRRDGFYTLTIFQALPGDSIPVLLKLIATVGTKPLPVWHQDVFWYMGQ